MDTIPEAEVIRRLAAESPWWEPPHQVGAEIRGYRPRSYLPAFRSLVQSREVRRAVVLLGARRVGKTVLVHQTIQELLAKGVPPRRIAYISVDLPLYNGLALEHLIELAESGSEQSLDWVFFDEIQYLPKWEVHLKRLVDDRPALRIVVSGSAAAALRMMSRESGAGRFTEFLLPPVTFAEYLDLTGAAKSVEDIEGLEDPDIPGLNQAFVQYVNFGGYPEAALNPAVRADPARYIKSDIVDKVLLRDLPQLYGIGDIPELNRLFTALAWNTSGEVSLDTLSKHSGVAKNTLRKYLEYLEAAFLIRVVHRVDRDAKHFRRATTFKVYLTNPSLRTALFAPIGENDEMMGRLAETAVVAQCFHEPGPVHYARWGEAEVDLVRLGPDGGAVEAVELKWSDQFADAPEGLTGLLRFARANGLTRVTATTRTRSVERAVGGVTIRMLPTSEYAWRIGVAATRRHP